jgi:ankyrin repeat protein
MILDLRLTVLMEASENGDQATVKSLLDAGANANARDTFGYTPLHWATFHSWVHGGPVVDLLVAHGADINAKANNGTTIPLLADLNADPEVRKALEHATTQK